LEIKELFKYAIKAIIVQLNLNKSNTITIIIPTLNEEEGIERTIHSIPWEKLNKKYNTELLIVDGNSVDRTVEISKKCGARVIMESRRGYGRAYKTGFKHATGNIIVTLDADNTYPAERIPDYVKELEQRDLDFITVNRFFNMEVGFMSFTHRIGNFVLSALLRAIYSVNIRDSQSGMWVLKKRFADRLSIASNGMEFSQDIKIVAFKYFKSMEIGGTYFERLGNAKMNIMNDGISNLKNLFTFKRELEYCLIPIASELTPLMRS